MIDMKKYAYTADFCYDKFGHSRESFEQELNDAMQELCLSTGTTARILSMGSDSEWPTIEITVEEHLLDNLIEVYHGGFLTVADCADEIREII